MSDTPKSKKSKEKDWKVNDDLKVDVKYSPSPPEDIQKWKADSDLEHKKQQEEYQEERRTFEEKKWQTKDELKEKVTCGPPPIGPLIIKLGFGIILAAVGIIVISFLL